MKRRFGTVIAMVLCFILTVVSVYADDGKGQNPDYVTDYYMIVQSTQGGVDIYDEDDCKQHKECMHKHGRNDLDYRKHTDIKNDFFYQIIVFQQRICPPHQRILEKEPWHNTCYQIKNKRNSQIPCSGTKTYREYKPVYQDRDHRLDKRPHNSQIRTCISCFEIILCKLCNKPSVLINIHR